MFYFPFSILLFTFHYLYLYFPLIPTAFLCYIGILRAGAFGKSPYLNVTYCIDLKIGKAWPHDFRKRNIITRAENTILPSEQH